MLNILYAIAMASVAALAFYFYYLGKDVPL
jgi:hypothetical protein